MTPLMLTPRLPGLHPRRVETIAGYPVWASEQTGLVVAVKIFSDPSEGPCMHRQLPLPWQQTGEPSGR